MLSLAPTLSGARSLGFLCFQVQYHRVHWKLVKFEKWSSDLPFAVTSMSVGSEKKDM